MCSERAPAAGTLYGPGFARTISGMNDTRFELRLPCAQRRELAELAQETGLSASDLARLAVRRLIADPGVLLVRGSDSGERAAGR